MLKRCSNDKLTISWWHQRSKVLHALKRLTNRLAASRDDPILLLSVSLDISTYRTAISAITVPHASDACLQKGPACEYRTRTFCSTFLLEPQNQGFAFLRFSSAARRFDSFISSICGFGQRYCRAFFRKMSSLAGPIRLTQFFLHSLYALYIEWSALFGFLIECRHRNSLEVIRAQLSIAAISP